MWQRLPVNSRLQALPLPASGLPVPLLRVALASSASGRGPGSVPGAAGAPDPDGGPALALHRRATSVDTQMGRADQLNGASTCPGLVAALAGRISGSEPVTVLSLLARSSGWDCSEGRGSVWMLSFRLGTNFGDSKKGTDDVTHDGEGFIDGPGVR